MPGKRVHLDDESWAALDLRPVQIDIEHRPRRQHHHDHYALTHLYRLSVGCELFCSFFEQTKS